MEYKWFIADVATPLFSADLVRYTNPHDGQTLLHRAALGCHSDNITVLLRTDEKLANLQDHHGNTALQIACSKAHKPAVKALLVREDFDGT